MSELDRQIRRWRKGVECESSLSPRELDEVEDHLRARVELEMQLDSVLLPAHALAIAQAELGGAVALSREFVKAGKPRWRRWLAAGLAMFATSFFMPVVDEGLTLGWIPGWEALLLTLDESGSLFEVLSALSNGLVVVTLVMLRHVRPAKARWLTGLMTAATALNLHWAIMFVLWGDNPLVELGIGYWAWVASFGCTVAALWLRDREWESARVKEVVA